MLNKADSFTKKVGLLKEARLQLLQLHKMLVDSERKRFENENGAVSGGKFLNLLIGDDDFKWLRKFSELIVRIDEMFDLDDGYHVGFVNKYLKDIGEIVLINTEDNEFNKRFKNVLEKDSKIKAKNKKLEILLRK